MKYYIVQYLGLNYSAKYHIIKCKEDLIIGAKYKLTITSNDRYSDFTYQTTAQIINCITSKKVKQFNIDINSLDLITDATLSQLAPIDDNINNIYFNKEKRTTTILWKDGSYTTVKCSENDEWDEEKAISLCYMKRKFNNRGCYNEVFKKWIKE